jgi:GAF domain-containing protein
LLLRDELRNPAWMAHPDWAEREGIQSIAGYPLMFRGENLGVLGVFSRELISAQQFRWLGVFADQAAVSIVNARAFEELDALRVRLELENDYLRSEVKENFGGLLG